MFPESELSADIRRKPCMSSFNALRKHLENIIHYQLVNHSIKVLRIALGGIFLFFGALKFFPGVSPAEGLVQATIHILSFGLVPDRVGVIAVAILECSIGASLLFGRYLHGAILLLTLQLIGVLSPLVLLPGRLFSGPYDAPTLEGQYVIKDIILVGVAMVIAAGTFKGGRLVREHLPPTTRVTDASALDGEQKLSLILEAATDTDAIVTACEQHDISEAEFYSWRETARAGAICHLNQEHADRVADTVAVH